MNDTVQVVSICDRDTSAQGSGRLCVDIGDIIRALGPGADRLSWLVNLWEWQGPRDLLDQAGLRTLATGQNQLLGAVLTTDQLLTLYQPWRPVVTVDGEFRAIPGYLGQAELASLANFPESKACLEIKAWDDAFTVMTKLPIHVEALRAHFKCVHNEDPTGFC